MLPKTGIVTSKFILETVQVSLSLLWVCLWATLGFAQARLGANVDYLDWSEETLTIGDLRMIPLPSGGVAVARTQVSPGGSNRVWWLFDRFGNRVGSLPLDSEWDIMGSLSDMAVDRDGRIALIGRNADNQFELLIVDESGDFIGGSTSQPSGIRVGRRTIVRKDVAGNVVMIGNLEEAGRDRNFISTLQLDLSWSEPLVFSLSDERDVSVRDYLDVGDGTAILVGSAPSPSSSQSVNGIMARVGTEPFAVEWILNRQFPPPRSNNTQLRHILRLPNGTFSVYGIRPPGGFVINAQGEVLSEKTFETGSLAELLRPLASSNWVYHRYRRGSTEIMTFDSTLTDPKEVVLFDDDFIGEQLVEGPKGWLWVVSGEKVARLHPETLNVEETINVPVRSALWTCSANGNMVSAQDGDAMWVRRRCRLKECNNVSCFSRRENLVKLDLRMIQEPSIAVELPESLELTNFPNPFNNVTTISFGLDSEADIRISIYTADGRFIRTLANRRFSPGRHSIPFNATGLGSGVYFYSLEANGRQTSQKMILLK